MARPNANSHLQTCSKEFIEEAFLDLQENVRNNEKLLELVDNYYFNTLKTAELFAAVQLRLNPTNNTQSQEEEEGDDHDPSLILDKFLLDLTCLDEQQLLMRVTLQPLDKSLTDKLHRINALKVSAALFSAAAAISAFLAVAYAKYRKPAAVAAGASILFCAFGKWVHMILERRESAVMKHKETIGAMVVGAKIIMKHVSDIHVVARRLQLETQSLSETVDDEDDGEILAAVKKSFQELRGKADVYSQDLKCAKQLVLHTIIKLWCMC